MTRGSAARPARPNVSRRMFLAGLGAVVVTGCSSGDSTTFDDAGIGDFESTDPAFMTAAFPAGGGQPTILATGSPQRALFGLTRGTGYLNADLVPAELEMMLTAPSGTALEVELPRRSEQIPRHYYTLHFEPAEVGTWNISGEFEGEALSVDFKVAEPEAVDLLPIGSKMLPAETPTVDNPRGVDPICTRAPEPCPFHELTWSEALATGGPAALMISTPGFCQTGICGPTLEILIAELAGTPDFGEYSVVHAEVYTDPQQLGQRPPSELVAPVVQTFGLTFEPSLIVANDDGLMAARLDVSMDGAEIREALRAGLA